MKLHELTEDSWDDAESRRTTPNPLPIPDSATLNKVFDVSDDIESKLVAKYRESKEYANTPYPELSRKVRSDWGTMEDVPISKIVGSEKLLDGEHLRALVHNKPTTTTDNVITLIKSGDKYYVQDGNHRVVAAAFRGDETINALVLDVNNI